MCLTYIALVVAIHTRGSYGKHVYIKISVIKQGQLKVYVVPFKPVNLFYDLIAHVTHIQ